MWAKTDDDSIVDANGKVLFFSTQRFVNDICLGDCCFICGAKPNETAFNNEHVFPEWLLRRYALFDKKITLPNGSEVRYDRFTVPCCFDCNSLMGDVVETPISRAVRGGASAVNDFVARGELLKMFVWMGLVYLKTHLKDRALRLHLDARKGQERIADAYEWEDLHHIHSLVRCFYTGAVVEVEAIGSFLVIPVQVQGTQDRFDYGDLYLAQTMFVRFDDTALLAVLNDSGGAMTYFWRVLEKITEPVSELQLREIMVELAYLNLHLKERPTFFTECDTVKERLRIVGQRPALDLVAMDPQVRGKMLLHAVKHALPHIRVAGQTHEQIVDAM